MGSLATAWRGARAAAGCVALLAAGVAAAAQAQAIGRPDPAVLAAVDPMVADRLREAWAAVESETSSAAAWRRLGAVYHAHELTDPAAECYRQAVRRDPGDARAWYLLAHAEADLGDPEAALESVARAIELSPSYAPAHWRRGRWLLGLGETAAAERSFRAAIEADSGDPAGWVGLGRILLGRGEARQAIGVLERALAIDPANGVAGQLLGTAQRLVGDTAAARRTLALATGMGGYFPDPWHEEMQRQAAGVGNLLRLLSARLGRGEVAPVIAELEALRRDHSQDVGVLNMLSEAYLAAGQPAPALAALENAYAADPEEFATLIHLAQAEKMRGELASALAWADRAAAVNPRFWQVHFERAAILHREGRFDECLEALARGMRYGAHQNPNAWLMQGDAALQLGRWAEAERSFEAAAARFPFLGSAFVGLALARAEAGRLPAAREALAAARELVGEGGVAAVAERIEELERPRGGGAQD